MDLHMFAATFFPEEVNSCLKFTTKWGPGSWDAT